MSAKFKGHMNSQSFFFFFLVVSNQVQLKHSIRIKNTNCSNKTFGILLYYFYNKSIIGSPLLLIPCFKLLVKRKAILQFLFQPYQKWQCLSKLYSWLTSTGRKQQLFCLVHRLSNCCMLHLKLSGCIGTSRHKYFHWYLCSFTITTFDIWLVRTLNLDRLLYFKQLYGI